jgi:hypothetical protein
MLRPSMLFAAKCYWPGVTEADLDTLGRRAAEGSSARARDPVMYLGSLLFADDDLVLCFLDGPSRPTVQRSSDRAGIPYERLMGALWLGPNCARELGLSR